MITNNSEILSKSKVQKFIQNSKKSSFKVFDLTTSGDIKELNKDIEKFMKNGSVSIILIDGGK